MPAMNISPLEDPGNSYQMHSAPFFLYGVLQAVSLRMTQTFQGFFIVVL